MHGFFRKFFQFDTEHYRPDFPSLSHRALWTTQYREPATEYLGFESALGLG